ncbi:MAG: FecR domain-containing protein [Tannerella sp.]|jgi:ferric-dicitrate binding protein FerR (iron transport regulator)|nr:FecR domain-containing protein [Tannerella sp.]
MVFKEKEKEYKVTDIAWEHLYKRIEQDGLLSAQNLPKRPFRKTALPVWAAAVAALVAGAVLALYILQNGNTRERDLQVIHNEANTPTLATMLHDGSVVYLSEQTSLEYPDSFDAGKREVFLRGEAFFDVKKNAGQPFFVNTDLVTIEVTGTSFDVKSNTPSSFRLSVRNGKVRVSLKKQHQTVSAQTGETVSFDSGKLQLSKTSANDFDAYFRRIHFKDERLDNIAHIINMTSGSVRIKVAPEVEGRRITFTLSGNRDIEAICLALNLQYREQGHTIYISNNEN